MIIARIPSIIVSLGLAISIAAKPLGAQQAKLIRISSKSVLSQQSKDLILLWEKYLAAEWGHRSRLGRDLEKLAKERFETLSNLIRLNPETLLEQTLPAELRTSLPSMLQRLIEQKVLLEGIIEDDQAPQARLVADFPYQLRDHQGHSYHLICNGAHPAFVTGSRVMVEGVRLDNQLVFIGGTNGGLSGYSQTLNDTQAPELSFVSPQEAAVLRGSVSIQLKAVDNNRVIQVETLVDNTSLQRLSVSPFRFDWDTTQVLDGPHSLSARGHDPDLNVGTAHSLTVTVDNTPPQIRLINPQNRAAVTGRIELLAEAHDVIGVSTVKFLVDGMVVGVSLSPPYTFIWNSEMHANGEHALEAIAVDRAGNTTASEHALIKVLNANSAPMLDLIGSKTISESVTLNFKITARDPDGTRDTLTFSATNLPPWANFDPETQYFFGTPDFAEVTKEEKKVYEDVRFRVCDAQPLCDSETITITVTNINHPPVVSPLRAQTIDEGQAFSLAPIIHDPDGDPITCKIKRAPNWITFDENTCSLSGTPDYSLAQADEGIKALHGIRMEICDSEQACIEATLKMNIRHVNRRPTLELIRDKTVDEGKLLDIPLQANDPDGHAIILAAEGQLPEGAQFFDYGGGTGLITWQPLENEAGQYTVHVIASDGDLEDSETITITVRESSLTISGRVLDDLVRPVPGVMLECARSNDRKHTLITDANGYYMFKNLPRGNYYLKPEYGLRDNLPTKGIIHFSPLSQKVMLGSEDVKHVDFEALGF